MNNEDDISWDDFRQSTRMMWCDEDRHLYFSTMTWPGQTLPCKITLPVECEYSADLLEYPSLVLLGGFLVQGWSWPLARSVSSSSCQSSRRNKWERGEGQGDQGGPSTKYHCKISSIKALCNCFLWKTRNWVMTGSANVWNVSKILFFNEGLCAAVVSKYIYIVWELFIYD